MCPHLLKIPRDQRRDPCLPLFGPSPGKSLKPGRSPLPLSWSTSFWLCRRKFRSFWRASAPWKPRLRKQPQLEQAPVFGRLQKTPAQESSPSHRQKAGRAKGASRTDPLSGREPRQDCCPRTREVPLRIFRTLRGGGRPPRSRSTGPRYSSPEAHGDRTPLSRPALSPLPEGGPGSLPGGGPRSRRVRPSRQRLADLCPRLSVPSPRPSLPNVPGSLRSPRQPCHHPKDHCRRRLIAQHVFPGSRTGPPVSG